MALKMVKSLLGHSLKKSEAGCPEEASSSPLVAFECTPSISSEGLGGQRPFPEQAVPLESSVVQPVAVEALEQSELKAELKALRKFVKLACVALRAETARSAEAQAAAGEARSKTVVLQARVAALSEELAQARAQNDVIHANLVALRTAMLERETESERTIAGLEDELRRTCEAVGLCENDRERFHYVLALNGQEGSLPRSVLASDPESHLYKMYGGEWDYARNAEGRAIVTCHPHRWAPIVEYLATGAIPAERDPALLAQARYWNLQGLVNGLEALTPRGLFRSVLELEDSLSPGGLLGGFMERASINLSANRWLELTTA
ncbi:hypothetical protein KFL_004960110 [Klebsormidium nitens]|uniref:Uncharacterized protein n=1 Tax=Klebsormidium nitens TaxID=105231 RepID=A0A1Y1IJ85_KLENI|nr:hypothetical protein KFL_004960110 [Klebsormidium nitens]|eukprot:GAQ89201.1 hypothetical protein KFL_004960110 [Klebsormidium nitens]